MGPLMWLSVDGFGHCKDPHQKHVIERREICECLPSGGLLLVPESDMGAIKYVPFMVKVTINHLISNEYGVSPGVRCVLPHCNKRL